ncbi:MAG: ADOP family duplicated permease [Vicinamibacterales bacterium]
MRLAARLRALWRTLAGRHAADAALDDELTAYVDELTARGVAAGAAPDQARRAVLAGMGGIETVKERVREVRMGRLIDETLRDVAYTWRGLRKAPGFATAALATLALGVAANTAIFSVAHALLVQPLPFRDPDRLVFVWADQTAEGYPRAPLSGPELQDLDDRAALFDGFGAIWATTAALTGENDPEQLRVGFVTTDYFSLLGAEAALGRTFRTGDDAAGPPTAILLSAAVWQRRYGSDPAIVGRRIEVNGQLATVVGVMPVGFRLMMPPDAAVPDDLEAWIPLNRRFPEGPRGQRYLRVVGRMRPGALVADAQADVARVGREISAAHAFYGAAGRQFETVPLHLDATRDVRRPLVALSVGVAILLAIACVNVGSLLVARAAARGRETAVKTALGASTGRLVRQHLVESLVLGVLGAALGLVLGRWGLAALVAATPDTLSRLRLAEVDMTVAAACVASVVVWTVLLAAAPVAEARRVGVAGALQHDGRRIGGGRHRLRAALTIAQVAMSVVLVVGALLLVRTAQRVQQVDPGFRTGGMLSFRVALPGSRYPNQDAFNAFSRRLQQALAQMPGATAAAAMSHAPYDHVPNWGGPYVAVEGADPSTAPQADYRAVTPGLLEMLGVTLVEGRTFIETDDHHGAPVVIVDERLAARTWPGQSAIGRRLAVDPAVTGSPSAWTTVVGVVRHLRHRSPVEEVREQVYFPERQVPRNPAVYVVAAAGDPAALAAGVHEVVRRLDAALPIYDVRPLDAYAAEARALGRFTAGLAVVFAVAALLLACVGIYGVVAYSVTERHREFGIRLALGAAASQVVGLVLREGATMAFAGLLAGLVGAAAGAWWLRSQLYGIAPWDPVSLAATLPILLGAALAACLVPALRAVRTDPAEALRGE